MDVLRRHGRTWIKRGRWWTWLPEELTLAVSGGTSPTPFFKGGVIEEHAGGIMAWTDGGAFSGVRLIEHGNEPYAVLQGTPFFNLDGGAFSEMRLIEPFEHA